MDIILYIRNFLKEQRIENIHPDSDDLLRIQSQILYEKPMMREVFAGFYDTCINMDKRHFSGDGKRVEIGAGVSFLKKRYPEVIATDIKYASNLDMVVDALNMPFANNTIRGIYGINCFHHFPDPNKFFKELIRVLVPGGGCVLIDPYHGFIARKFYKKVFDNEGFDVTQKDWANESMGYMMSANQALSYIVFKRDKTTFKKKFPELEIVLQYPLNNYVRYLVSGGLNFRQLLPTFASPAIRATEFLFNPINRFMALHHVIVIRKNRSL